MGVAKLVFWPLNTWKGTTHDKTFCPTDHEDYLMWKYTDRINGAMISDQMEARPKVWDRGKVRTEDIGR